MTRSLSKPRAEVRTETPHAARVLVDCCRVSGSPLGSPRTGLSPSRPHSTHSDDSTGGMSTDPYGESIYITVS